MIILAFVLAFAGILGCVIPGLPGPPVSLGGLLCIYFTQPDHPVSTGALILSVIMVAAVTVLDYAIPAWTTSKLGGHKAASAGALVGLFAGLFFTPVGMLLGSLIGGLGAGFVLAIFMANSGGAWDNAKKYVEEGHLGGKNSDAHHATVVGDTVGDPFKDTSGPSLNILIKLMSMVSIVMAGLTVACHLL